MERVIVLNADYTFLNFCDWKRALALIKKGKAEPVKDTDKIVQNYDKTFSFAIPFAIKLLKFVRQIFKRKVPWSKKNVFIRDNYTCQYCGEFLKDKSIMELEHVIPRSHGGKSSFENCVTACQPCNRKKGDKTLREVKMYLKKRPVEPTINEFLNNKLKQVNGLSELLNEVMNDMVQ